MTALELGPTVAAARRALATAFRAEGFDSPDLDARLLVGHALALDHAGLVAQSERVLEAEETERIRAAAVRRLAGEPVARIRGSKEFWGLALDVSEAVLVPRPETETVVEAALACLHGRTGQPLRIADLGTGSGALMIALLRELSHATGVGTDRSLAALEIARTNAARHGVAPRAAFVACDFGAALAGGFDLVVSNPPYIASPEIAALPAEVRNFDPRLALDGGPDGLSAYRAIAADAGRLLGRGGTVIVEIGRGQEADVNRLMQEHGLTVLASRADLAGIARVVVASYAPGGPPQPKKSLGLSPRSD